ncbi:MAG TPA: ABC transporter permease [Candidatus Acidoferrales bacterium]|nr:ABC transporter permease [Candidatus Acidoferrales bacterium]
MRILRGLFVRLASLFSGKSRDREFARELESHIALHTDENLRAGLSIREARREALLKLGGIEQARDFTRSQRGVPMIESFLQDLRVSLRTLRKNPGFTAVAILTLALGIGANAAIFSVIDAMLLRALPYPAPERMVHVDWSFEKAVSPAVSAPEYMFLRDHARSFEALAIADLSGSGANLSAGSHPEFVHNTHVTASFFELLGTNAFLGRTFTTDDERPSAPNVAILSHGFWQSSFGGDSQILGRRLIMDSAEFTIIGVLPSTFEFSNPSDVWTPVQLTPGKVEQIHKYSMIARLRSGTTIEQARNEMPGLLAQMRATDPGNTTPADRGPLLTAYHDWLVGQVSTMLWILFGAVGLILLIAAVNVTSLLLAKTSARVKELAMRSALGATRLRLLQQLVSESVTIAILGGIAGLAVASATLRLVLASAPKSLFGGVFPFLSFQQQMRLTGPVLLFAFGIALLTGVLIGIFASLRATRVDLNDALKTGTPASTASRHRAHRVLIVTEFALSVVLLAGAVLLIRTLHELQSVSLGFQPDHLWSVEFSMPLTRHASTAEKANFERQIIENVSRIPGVQSAAVTGSPLLQPGMFDMAAKPGAPPSAAALIQYHAESSGAFATVGISLLAGRAFTDADSAASAPVAVVNQALAKLLWPNADAVGQDVNCMDGAPRRVIGVVANAKQMSLAESSPFPAVYVPAAQQNDKFAATLSSVFLTTVLIRAQIPPQASAVAQAIEAVDPTVAVANFQSVDQVASESLGQQKFQAGLLGVFASLALLLAAVGTYGVLAYVLSRLTHEIGIRIALGASRTDVLTLALRQGMIPVLLGIAIGIPGALALTRLMSTLLYGVTSSDPVTYVSVALILGVVAICACYLPARRAMRVDPLVALRHE